MGPDADEVFNGLAVHGALSRTVRDSATLLDLIHGPESGDPYFAAPPRRPYAEESTRDPGRLHVGLLTTPGTDAPWNRPYTRPPWPPPACWSRSATGSNPPAWTSG